MKLGNKKVLWANIFGPALLAGFLVFFVLLAGPLGTQTNDTATRGPLNKDFLNYLNNQGAAARLTPDGHYLGRIPGSHPVSTYRPPDRRVYLLPPAAYDLRTQSKLTPVKNQGVCGSCWAFATYGSLESYLMPGELADYSENDLITKHGWYWGPCSGGHIYMSMGYLGGWKGPINEADNPYPYSYIYSSSTVVEASTVRKHVQNAVFFPARASSTDNQILKEAVMTYGAIYTTMDWCSGAYSGTHYSYYDDGSYSVNGGHAVCIVGWNDNYAASNFNKTAPGNGAFIVRNSWGAGWGESGYFYVSYNDRTFGKDDYSAAVLSEPTSNYVSVYQYDPLGWVQSWGYGTSTAWGANIFTAADTKALTAVSFYAVDAGVSYEVYIYTGVTAGKPRTGTLQTSTSGSLTYAGYYTIDLPTAIFLTAGQKFSVVIKFTLPSAGWPVPTEDYTSWTTGATASAGQSFMDSSGTIGVSWEDRSASTYKSNICIKAFTGSMPIIAVTAPASGTNWYRGSVCTITWTKSGTQSANVKIQLYKGNTMVKTISLSTPNDGSYDWTIPNAQGVATNYRILVKTTDGMVSDYSDYFTISKPTITIAAPASGTNWYRGSVYTITWTKSGTQSANVKIQLYKGNTMVKTISLSTPNDGSYDWTIPNAQALAANYRILVKTTDNKVSDYSDYFTITKPTITISSPAAGVTWTRGTTPMITWTKTGTQNANVKIQLFRGTTLVGTIAATAPNSGSYAWPIPLTLKVASNYKIKIKTLDGYVTSSSPFFVIN